MKGLSLEKISIAHRKHSSIYDWSFSIRSERVKAIKDRLQTAIDELKVNVDENRFELIYYLEKLDITEEKVRLTNHLDYFLET
jgi:uncharacterized protein YicC (UPF0701 family)